jgi:hypothetical protein
MTSAGYGIVKREGKRGTIPHLHDAVFRSRIISIAAGGMSRRGVAAMAGIAHQTLLSWLERGRAHPEEEPWGSFAVDYERASRGLEGAASGTVALTVARLYKLAREERWEELNECGPQMKELLNVLAARYPEDWGTHAHRKPEPEPDGDAWLERAGITHVQLVHMLKEPPEQVRAALVEAGDDVYALLLASGWKAKTE